MIHILFAIFLLLFFVLLRHFSGDAGVSEAEALRIAQSFNQKVD